MAMKASEVQEPTRKLEVEDYADKEKKGEAIRVTEKPSDFVLLKRIERDIAQLSEAGLAYLRTKLAQPKEE
jgi:hypothetical protein